MSRTSSEISSVAEQLFGHWDAMVAASERILSSRADAEDCAAEALLAALRHPDLAKVTNLRAWLVAVSKRRAADLLRTTIRDRRRLVRLAGQHEPHDADVADGVVDRAEAAWVSVRATEILPSAARAVLASVADGATAVDAANRHGLSRRAAESHLLRGRRVLRATLAASAAIVAWAFGLVRKAAPAAPVALVAAALAVTLGSSAAPYPAPDAGSAGDVSHRSTGALEEQSALRPGTDSLVVAKKEIRIAEPVRRAAVPAVPRSRRIGNGVASATITKERREGPSDPAGIMLDCVQHLRISLENPGC